MKKIVVLLACSIVPISLWAQDIRDYSLKKGDNMASVFMGASGSSQKLEGSKWANTGVTYGAQVMTFPAEYFGIGLEIMGTNFSQATTSETWSERYWDPYVCPGGCYTWKKYSEIDKIKTRVTNFMLAGRVNLNPKERVRFYVPLGVGFARTKMSINGSYTAGSVTEDIHLNSDKTGLAWYLGGGLEVEVYRNWLLGIEGRYTQFDLKIQGVETTYHPHYFTGIAKIAYKF